ncbi:O-antigen ligase [Sulfurovum sp. TSL1]|uniref:O-antigen ligase family protein n=1 Tax=Sulfurovum sp. TSL1 TaxID=2826994 RepID=UPI001CC3A9EB|nr:O-antigen ligase family protein [Sulfurovum sp. TSL1]GIT98464.1 hypothetical protein TSL1_12850 [Sulfurovum sp. TSL1]
MKITKFTLNAYQKFQEESLFIRIFQITLFIWLFSIPLKNAIYQISTVLIIILFLIHYFYYKQKDFLLGILTTYKKVLIVFLLFIASMLLSTLFGISEKHEIFSIFKYIYRYIFIFIILLYFYKQSFFSKKYLLSAIFIVLFINSLDGIYQYFVGLDFIGNKPPDRSLLLTGAVYHHNPFGLLMTIAASMSLVLFFDKNNYTIFKYDKIFYFVALLMFLFTLFHSQSRSAWVMFGIISVGYMFVYIKNYGIDKKLFFSISTLLIISTLFFLVDDNLFHRLTLLIQGNSSGRTTIIWPFTIEKIMDSPILGYGINTYKMLAVGTPSVYHAGVHNLTLEFLLYTGIIGFSIFLYLIIITLKESFSKRKIIYFILFSSYFILLQFDGSLIDGKVHQNIFILLLFFIYSFRLDKNTSSEQYK